MESNFSVNNDFSEYIKLFLQENSKLNLISKNDEKYIYEKHIYDSLSIKLFFQKYGLKQKVLDIGCGGGFPTIPISIEFPEIDITGVDSIRKKINAVNNIKNELNLPNLKFLCQRVETIKEKYDLIVTRAMAKLPELIKLSTPILNKNGYLIAYKSKKITEEIEASKTILKSENCEIIDIIPYTLPLEEIYERVLVVIKKN